MCPRDKHGMKSFNIARERMVEYQEQQMAKQNRQDLLKRLYCFINDKTRHVEYF